jgi:hypothetical protein
MPGTALTLTKSHAANQIKCNIIEYAVPAAWVIVDAQ